MDTHSRFALSTVILCSLLRAHAQEHKVYSIDDSTIVRKISTIYLDEPEFASLHQLIAVPYLTSSTLHFVSLDYSDTVLTVQVKADSSFFTEYWPNNQPRMTWIEVLDSLEWNNSRLVVVRYYCENGQLRRENWEDKLIYNIVTYHCNGLAESRFLRVINPAVRSGVVGPVERFHSNGRQAEYREYDYGGLPTGVWRRWDENGKLLDAIDYR